MIAGQPGQQNDSVTETTEPTKDTLPGDRASNSHMMTEHSQSPKPGATLCDKLRLRTLIACYREPLSQCSFRVSLIRNSDRNVTVR